MLLQAEMTYSTHQPPDKMAVILADDNLKCIFLNENDIIPNQIPQKLVSRSPINNKAVLVQVIARHRTGETTLPELMLTRFTDAYISICGTGEMS